MSTHLFGTNAMLSRIYPAIHERISYMLLQNSKGDYNIFYVDYLTQQLVYLSSKLQSLYNEELDTITYT